MSHQVPPQDLWDRLRSLDRTCDITLDRRAASDEMFWGSPRTWWITIQSKRVPGARMWDTVRSQHPTLTEAIRIACEQAEALGWHRVEPGPSVHRGEPEAPGLPKDERP